MTDLNDLFHRDELQLLRRNVRRDAALARLYVDALEEVGITEPLIVAALLNGWSHPVPDNRALAAAQNLMAQATAEVASKMLSGDEPPGEGWE